MNHLRPQKLLLFCALFFFQNNLFANQPAPAATKTSEDKGSREDLSNHGRAPSSEIPEVRQFPLNPQIDPCQDFYGYVCSDVISSFRLREDRSTHTFSLSDSHERILEKKKAFLNGLASGSNDSFTLNRSDKKDQSPLTELRQKQLTSIRQIFVACTNTEAEKKEESDIFSKTVSALNGQKTHLEFKDFVIESAKMGGFNFVEFGSISNLNNPDFKDLYLDAEAVQTLPERSYYADSKKMAAFIKVLQSFIKLMHPQMSLAETEKRAQEIVDFEKNFSQSYPLPAEFRKLLTLPSQISLASLQSNFSALPIGGYLQDYANALTLLKKNTSSDKANILIRDFTPQNLTWLNKQLSGEVDNLAMLKDWYAFKSLAPQIDNLYPEFFDRYYQFTVLLGAPPKRPNLIERCTNTISRNLGMEFDNILLPQIFPNFDKPKFTQLIEKIVQAILRGVSQNTWLSLEAKTAAIEKVKKSELMLAQPEQVADWNFLPEGTYDEKLPWSNSKMLNQQKAKKEWEELSKMVNKHAWEMSPLTINAYYMPPNNQFVLPIGILQYPLYETSLSDIENLGAIGSVVGHELGHGIDDQGAKYDSMGVLRQWMTDEDLKQFKSRTKRLVEQFNKAGHNGELTLGENIGDLVGLTFAYNAAFKSDESHAITVEDQKRFFIQYGRVWCEIRRPEKIEFHLKTNPHALGWARINEQVKLQAGFTEAFACKPGQALTYDPQAAISVW